MRPTPIRLLTLTIAATVLVIPLIAATASDAGSRHLRTHHQFKGHAARHVRFHETFARDEVGPVTRPAFAGDPCQGASRSFDCKIWPPPIEFDPDRRNPAGDGM